MSNSSWDNCCSNWEIRRNIRSQPTPMPSSPFLPHRPSSLQHSRVLLALHREEMDLGVELELGVELDPGVDLEMELESGRVLVLGWLMRWQRS